VLLTTLPFVYRTNSGSFATLAAIPPRFTRLILIKVRIDPLWVNPRLT
jgi:hypothetical protein